MKLTLITIWLLLLAYRKYPVLASWVC